MSDYISREEAEKRIDEALSRVFVEPVGKSILSKLPAADVRPVVRGHWKLRDGGVGVCSNCKAVLKDVWDYDSSDPFCSECGADMREDAPFHGQTPPKVKVYGYSDDLVAIEGSRYKENEIDCYDRDVRIRFEDGTVIRVGYSKPDLGVWYIIIEYAGHAAQTLTECMDEDADVYSDVFEIDSEVLTHEVVRKEAAQ